MPVPLTLIGILLGHWMFGAAFTATSMIGFIALAGIIVRNSILLVDFIRHLRAGGVGLRDAVLEAGAIRFKPILLTAVAAMVGAAFILTDPIFQGLAISMLFGLLSSTLLTVLVIPAIYVVLRGDPPPPARPTAAPTVPATYPSRARAANNSGRAWADHAAGHACPGAGGAHTAPLAIPCSTGGTRP